MKKVVSKPLSSPSRTEKFPPPLMRFLRSNVGSKSRGRCRASPMFVRKKNAAIETQEPSSPKVTCIGQVRVRRSSKRSSRSNSGSSRTSPAKCPSLCLPKNPFTNLRKPNLTSFQPVWRKWVSCFEFGYCRKTDVRNNSSKSESYLRRLYRDSETEDCDDEDQETQGKAAKEVYSPIPPKNALLLTRCRSAPYRSSSSFCRFSGSPQATLETEDADETEESCNFEEQEMESNSRKSVRADQESLVLEINKQFEGLINGRNSEGSHRSLKKHTTLEPLILTRCKSEPAKTGERLITTENHYLLMEPNKVGFRCL